nr:LysE family translocator [Brucella intermedia]
MPHLETFITFLVTTAIFAYIPGPAMIYAAAQTLARGRYAGLMAALGIHLGGYFHVLVAAAGLSVLFHLVPGLYAAVKFLGAAYLVWLGVSLFRINRRSDERLPTIGRKTARRAFFESIVVEVLNPKTAIFFVSFLPQFIDVSALFPVWLQFLILGTIVNLLFSSADVLCVALASTLAQRMHQSGPVQLISRRAGGILLVGLGTRLALQSN